MNVHLSSLIVAGGLLIAPLAAAEETANRPSTLERAVLEQGMGPGAALHLSIPGFHGQPSLQVLTSPDRVVVDLPGVIRGAALTRKDIGAIQNAFITKSRIAQFAIAPVPVTRVVLEVEKGTQAEVALCDGGIRIMLASGEGRVQAKFLPDVVSNPSPVAPSAKEPVVAEIAQAVNLVDAQPKTEMPVPTVPLSELPTLGNAYQALPALSAAVLMPAAPPAAPATSPAQQDVSTAAHTDARSGKTLGEVTGRYTGTPMSIDVPSLELSAFLRIIGDHAKLNIVSDPDTQGRIFDVKFTDTPWDLILDIVLKHAGLGKEVNYGVMRIAKMETLQKEEKARMDLEEAKSLAGDVQSITRPLSYSKVSEAKAVLEKVLTKRGSIITDERTNTLIISDLPKNLGLIDDLIATLDVSIQQVQIEARVVEANKGYEKAFGVQWPSSSAGAAKLTVGGSDATWASSYGPSWNSANGNTPIYDPTTGKVSGVRGSDKAVAWSADNSISAPAGQFWVSFLSNRFSVNAILQAMERDGVIKIVSSPKVVTQNNKKAKILSGEKIPYPTQQGGAAGGAITVAFADANLELDVTPQITSDGTILMDLKIEKAEADFSRTVMGTPTILRKMVETQVLVYDGGTAVLGGVYVTNHTSENKGIPFLRKLPGLGFLFRTKSDKDTSAELLIFITPRILKQ